MDRIIACLRPARLPVEDEKRLQAAIADHLYASGVAFEREVKVAGGIIDFLSGGVGIEVKIKGGKRQIWRQCRDYCEEPRIAALIVLTCAPVALPAVINNKPVTVLDLGRAWL